MEGIDEICKISAQRFAFLSCCPLPKNATHGLALQRYVKHRFPRQMRHFKLPNNFGARDAQGSEKATVALETTRIRKQEC